MELQKESHEKEHEKESKWERVKEWVTNKTSENEELNFSKVTFAEVIRNLNELYGDNIANQFVFQAIVDSMYPLSKTVITGQIILLFTFVFAFIIQAYHAEHSWSIMLCMNYCLVMQIFFILIEFIELR